MLLQADQNAREDFLNRIWGFRYLFVMDHLLFQMRENTEHFFHTINENPYMTQLQNALASDNIHLERMEIVQCLIELIYIIEHAINDCTRHWPNFFGYSDEGGVDNMGMGVSHKNDRMERAYIRSMHELQKTENWDFSKITPTLESLRGKKNFTILDYGCGSGFFLEMFMMAQPKLLVGYDRPSVINRIINQIHEPPYLDNLYQLSKTTGTKLILLDDLGQSEKADFIWVSEVLHGKPDPIKFLMEEIIQYNAHPDTIVAICELKRNGVRNQLFGIQMHIHTQSPIRNNSIRDMFSRLFTENELSNLIFPVSFNHEVLMTTAQTLLNVYKRISDREIIIPKQRVCEG